MGTLDIPKNIPTNVIDNKDFTLDEPEHFQANVDLKPRNLSSPSPKPRAGWPDTYTYSRAIGASPSPSRPLSGPRPISRPVTPMSSSAPSPSAEPLGSRPLPLPSPNGPVTPPTDPAHPLLVNNPHDLVPFMEYKVYAGAALPDLGGLPSPRLFGTHVPYGSLPESVKSSGCKIVYICRNPFDTLLSTWVFMSKGRQQIKSEGGVSSIEEAFDMYCNGEVTFGPFWDHLLGYWNASLKSPDKVMFLKYEDMKNDPGFTKIKELAKFLGYEFSAEEETEGVVEEVARCSFETMKDLKVNQAGNSVGASFGNDTLFRKAKEMIERLTKVRKEKLVRSGLEFDM
ncbi:hypothetical protein V2J09_000980 [Rumex salicifolius]